MTNTDASTQTPAAPAFDVTSIMDPMKATLVAAGVPQTVATKRHLGVALNRVGVSILRDIGDVGTDICTEIALTGMAHDFGPEITPETDDASSTVDRRTVQGLIVGALTAFLSKNPEVGNSLALRRAVARQCMAASMVTLTGIGFDREATLRSMFRGASDELQSRTRTHVFPRYHAPVTVAVAEPDASEAAKPADADADESESL